MSKTLRSWEELKGLHVSTIFSKSVGYHIMQFTGLKDKNGKEIYEGDILGSYEGEEVGWYFAGKVGWWQEEGKFILQNSGNFSSDDEHWDTPSEWKSYEVIGNIYENPELLKNHE